MSEPTLYHIYERQGETNAKLDALLKGFEDHETRIGALEKQWMRLFGWAGAIATGLGVTFKIILGKRA